MTYEITPGKGKEGENCNVTACQRPHSADYYNVTTRSWYCFQCACTIEAWAHIDGMSHFPGTVSELIKPLSPTDKLNVARLQLVLEEPEALE